MPVRPAVPADLPEILRVTNLAYQVEKFFIESDRLDEAETAARFADGRFLVVDGPAGLAGSVWVQLQGDGAFFGLLAVDPGLQKAGVGRQLVTAAEELGRAAGCTHMDIHVVNIREELPPYYKKLGYAPTGATKPFEHLDLKTPCHFIRMSKPL